MRSAWTRLSRYIPAHVKNTAAAPTSPMPARDMATKTIHEMPAPKKREPCIVA